MTEPESSKLRVAARRPGIAGWNRKLHIHLGLYLLLFLWLFAFSGLLLNHPGWRFAQFWPQRKVSSTQRMIQLPSTRTDQALAADLMKQLSLTGELEWTETRPGENQFRFRVQRPGTVTTVTVQRDSSSATVETIRVNVWGILRALHTFTGVSLENPDRTRDWLPTRLWSAAMDAVAVGSIVLVLSSLHMWYRLKPKRWPGLIALCIGLIACGCFVFGLALMF